MSFPLPFTLGLRRYAGVDVDEHNNEVEVWAPPVKQAAAFYLADSTEPASPGNAQRLVADAIAFVDISVAVKPHDHVVIPELGGEFDVEGLPQNWNYGPWGYQPDRLVLALRRVDG